MFSDFVVDAIEMVERQHQDLSDLLTTQDDMENLRGMTSLKRTAVALPDATSDQRHQRFLCIYCTKYTHICDPFRVCAPAAA